MKSITLKSFIILALSLISSCAKEKQKVAENNQSGRKVMRYELVSVKVSSNTISLETYEGFFANKPIKLSKVSEEELVFYVPETTALGFVDLDVKDLGNLKIKYEVIEVELKASVDDVLLPLKTNFKAYSEKLTASANDAPFVNNQNNLDDYFNKLSVAEKTEVAKFYQVNQSIIDSIYNFDYSKVMVKRALGEIDLYENKNLVWKYKTALSIGIMGGVVALLEPSNTIRPIAIGVAIVGLKKALNFHYQIIDLNMDIIEVNINSVLGENKRENRATKELAFTNEKELRMPFAVNIKPITNTNEAGKQEFMSLFFTTKNKMNEFIGDINASIIWVNENIPLVNFDVISNVGLSANAKTSSANVNNEIMNHLKFSLNHPDLLLEKIKLESNGDLTIMIKCKNILTAKFPISSILNYSYADDFSSFSGSFNIVVNDKESELKGIAFWDKIETGGTCGKESYACNYQIMSTYTGGSPIGGTVYLKTFWDNEGDGVFEGEGGTYTIAPNELNTVYENGSFESTVRIGVYCWGNPKTNLKVEYYFKSKSGVISPTYSASVPR